MICCLFLGCEYIDTTNPQSSKNIKDSKKKNIYISEYNISKNQIDDDSIKFKAVEAWTENIWYYDNLLGSKTIEKDTQLVIRVDSLSLEELHSLRHDNNLSYTTRHGGKFTFRRKELKDTMKFKFAENEYIILTRGKN